MSIFSVNNILEKLYSQKINSFILFFKSFFCVILVIFIYSTILQSTDVCSPKSFNKLYYPKNSSSQISDAFFKLNITDNIIILPNIIILDFTKPKRMPAIEKITASLETLFTIFITKENLIAYYIFIISTLFFLFFIKDYFGNIVIANILSFAYICFLYIISCGGSNCDLPKYLVIFLIPPALFFINGTVNLSKHILFPLAIFFIAVIFSINLRVPILICLFFLAVSFLQILKSFLIDKAKPSCLVYFKQLILLAGITVSGYFISLFLTERFYYNAFHAVSQKISSLF